MSAKQSAGQKRALNALDALRQTAAKSRLADKMPEGSEAPSLTIILGLGETEDEDSEKTEE